MILSIEEQEELEMIESIGKNAIEDFENYEDIDYEDC